MVIWLNQMSGGLHELYHQSLYSAGHRCQSARFAGKSAANGVDSYPSTSTYANSTNSAAYADSASSTAIVF